MKGAGAALRSGVRIVIAAVLLLSAPARADGVIVETAAGPYATLDAMCDAHGGCRDRADADAVLPDGIRVARAPHAPFVEIRIVTTEALDVSCHVAMRTRAGWWLGRGFDCGSERARADITPTVTSIAVVAGEIVVALRITAVHDDAWDCVDCAHPAVHRSVTRALVVCGVGAAGPACTDAMPRGARTRRPIRTLRWP
jgi:hypothetical protein